MKKISFNNFTKEMEFFHPQFKDAVERVFMSGWFILGQEVADFEKQFADYLKVKYCIGVGNGLEALEISLRALGIKDGDEVITTPLSAAATVLAILAVGAKPVFVDVTENGLINVDLISKFITARTKAILPVHLYGQTVELIKIQRICKKYHLYLIEDACQAHGSSYQGECAGTVGNVGCFSFYPTKNLGALGDGGAIVTNNITLAKICREIRDYGQKEKYKHIRFGLNSRLDEIQAALLKVKLPFLDKNNQIRQALAKRYLDNLSFLKEVKIVQPLPESISNYHLFVIRAKNRDFLHQFLKDQGIATLIHYPITIPDQPFLKLNFKSIQIPIARHLTKQLLSLPCHPYLNFNEVDFICQKIIGYYQNSK